MAWAALREHDAGMARRNLLILMAEQDGVINRRQALRTGLSDADVRRLVRRRDWARVHPGVFINHTGPLTWQQRAWAAVLYAAPSALSGESALRAADGPGRRGHDDSSPIHIALDRDRQCRTPPGVVLHRVARLDDKVLWNLGPPRMRVEEALLDVAASAPDDLAAVAVLGDAVGSRRTTAGRVLHALERRTRVRRREFLSSVLADVDEGACSALEHRYLVGVERAHGLPSALRQVRASSRGPIFRDVVYESLSTAVELDGRLDHTRALDRDRDLERDLDAALDELLTIRLGWGQAVGRPCVTARKLARVLQGRGWLGNPRSCPKCRRGESQSSGDWKSPRSA
jgi:hypothetical protein